MRFFTYILLILTMFFWGGTFIAGRLLGEAINPASAAFLRFFIATITLYFLIFLSKEKLPFPTSRQWIGLFLLGATGVFAYNLCFFTGLKYINAGRAALIIAITPLTITILALLFFKEKLSPVKLGGILLSITGAIFVISNGHPEIIIQGEFGQGELWLLGCVLSWSAYTLIGKRMLNSLSPLVSVFYSSLIGSLLLLWPAIATGLLGHITSISANNWLELIYLGVFGTALGFSLYYDGIKKIGATQAGVFINLVPVFAVILSWSILGEAIKPSVLTGGIMILTGVSLTNYSNHIVKKVTT